MSWVTNRPRLVWRLDSVFENRFAYSSPLFLPWATRSSNRSFLAFRSKTQKRSSVDGRE
jgi:hypothetical protein